MASTTPVISVNSFLQGPERNPSLPAYPPAQGYFLSTARSAKENCLHLSQFIANASVWLQMHHFYWKFKLTGLATPGNH